VSIFRGSFRPAHLTRVEYFPTALPFELANNSTVLTFGSPPFFRNGSLFIPISAASKISRPSIRVSLCPVQDSDVDSGTWRSLSRPSRRWDPPGMCRTRVDLVATPVTAVMLIPNLASSTFSCASIRVSLCRCRLGLVMSTRLGRHAARATPGASVRPCGADAPHHDRIRPGPSFKLPGPQLEDLRLVGVRIAGLISG
jgi:hypothetical protein